MPVLYFPQPSDSADWGKIAGLIAEQDDLQQLLDTKSDTGHSHRLADLSEKNYSSLDGLPGLGKYAEKAGFAVTGGYIFDGTAYVQLGSLTGFDKDDEFTVRVKLRPLTDDVMCLWSRSGGNPDYKGYQLYLSSGKIYFRCYDSGTATGFRILSETVLAKGGIYDLTVRYTGSGEASGVELFINGESENIEIDLDAGFAGSVTNSHDDCLGRTSYGSLYYTGEIFEFDVFNYAIPDSEIIRLYSNGLGNSAIDFPDSHTTQNVLTSGILEFNKKYKIRTYNSGDDFTNCGGENTAGSVFTALENVPVDWSNSSEIIRAGNIASFRVSGAGLANWRNENHLAPNGICNGIIFSAKPERQIFEREGISSDTEFQQLLPQGYSIDLIKIENATANAVVLDLGISSGGAEILASESISGNSEKIFSTGFLLDSAIPLSLFIESANWNSAELSIKMALSRRMV
jgi:hypothetical protein